MSVKIKGYTVQLSANNLNITVLENLIADLREMKVPTDAKLTFEESGGQDVRDAKMLTVRASWREESKGDGVVTVINNYPTAPSSPYPYKRGGLV